jgi:hypothetical protein
MVFTCSPIGMWCMTLNNAVVAYNNKIKQITLLFSQLNSSNYIENNYNTVETLSNRINI